jgi:hypothetical protein
VRYSDEVLGHRRRAGRSFIWRLLGARVVGEQRAVGGAQLVKLRQRHEVDEGFEDRAEHGGRRLLLPRLRDVVPCLAVRLRLDVERRLRAFRLARQHHRSDLFRVGRQLQRGAAAARSVGVARRKHSTEQHLRQER